jgi:protein-S-isoprenylcysteine O-methyltransferase Ste14
MGWDGAGKRLGRVEILEVAMVRSVAVRDLVGSGDRIAAVTLPFLVLGVLLNIAFPGAFDVGGPPLPLRVASVALLTVGVVVWAWSVVLILVKVPRGELITTGPFALVRHPLYTGVALLVVPWVGLLMDTWLGVALGAALYAASRRYAPAEEVALARQFGAEWDAYSRAVRFPWL